MKTFVVLGMHRSATSLMGNGLHKNDVHMGDMLLPPGKNNPKGYFENRRFVDLNREILGAAGKRRDCWDDPPSREAILAVRGQFAKRIEELVKQESKGHELWGWKDPRTTLTIELFLPYLTNPHWVCTFRDPIEVGKSLHHRNKWPIEKGAKLAKVYNKRLIDFLGRWNAGNFDKK